MSAVTRDLAAPIPAPPIALSKSECGFAHDEGGSSFCGQPTAYRFRMKDWPSWRHGCVCPEHAMLVRRWTGVEWMRSLAGVR